MRARRIKTIYTKELVEICRDHRTLIAMIVVPIVLYPLLILGSVNLLSIQDTERKIKTIRVAVEQDPNADENYQPNVAMLAGILSKVRNLTEAKRTEDNNEDIDQQIESIEKTKIIPVDNVQQAVADGAADAGIVFKLNEGGTRLYPQHLFEIAYDKAELHSESAMNRLASIFEALSRNSRDQYLANANIPDSVIEPIRIEPINVATPAKVGGMVLGTIIPLVLVLMTITGAIYPAIDLTAGERERGTLETLIVCPVPPMELITGKYLVVATIALLGAALNLLSVGMTLYFGGFTEMISSGETELPLEVLPIILVALIPFALLFSAVMVAVCSYARTFKEAQNYIMPVILAALIPGGVAALPGTDLTGVNTVIPVMNMVLLARELLLGNWDFGVIALVMISTTMYAATAVVVASRVFSTESVVFADSLSLRSLINRKLIHPAPRPTVSMALLIVAVLFPLWMFVQFAIQPGENESQLQTFSYTAILMPLFLVLAPIAVLAYFKISIAKTLSLRLPRVRFLAGAILIGIAAWIPAHELFVLQGSIITVPENILHGNTQLIEAFDGYTILFPLLLIAVVPALCEELFFRGTLLSGLRTGARKWTVILATACVFAVFHVMLIKFVLTFALGIILGLICWNSQSIIPSVLAHMLHNASAVLISFWPCYKNTLGIADRGELDHLPLHIILVGIAAVAIGLLLCRKPSEPIATALAQDASTAPAE